MKVTYRERVERVCEVTGISIVIPTHEVERKDHAEFPKSFKIGDEYQFCIGMDGKIAGWPIGTVYDALWKPRDSGHYAIVSDEKIVAVFADDYVPHLLAWGGGGGDYLDMNVGEDGTVRGFVEWVTQSRLEDAIVCAFED